jgi:hypothetical protein
MDIDGYYVLTIEFPITTYHAMYFNRSDYNVEQLLLPSMYLYCFAQNAQSQYVSKTSDKSYNQNIGMYLTNKRARILWYKSTNYECKNCIIPDYSTNY